MRREFYVLSDPIASLCNGQSSARTRTNQERSIRIRRAMAAECRCHVRQFGLAWERTKIRRPQQHVWECVQ